MSEKILATKRQHLLGLLVPGRLLPFRAGSHQLGKLGTPDRRGQFEVGDGELPVLVGDGQQLGAQAAALIVDALAVVLGLHLIQDVGGRQLRPARRLAGLQALQQDIGGQELAQLLRPASVRMVDGGRDLDLLPIGVLDGHRLGPGQIAELADVVAVGGQLEADLPEIDGADLRKRDRHLVDGDRKGVAVRRHRDVAIGEHLAAGGLGQHVLHFLLQRLGLLGLFVAAGREPDHQNQADPPELPHVFPPGIARLHPPYRREMP